MLCRLFCVGIIKDDPKRSYSKADTEISHFNILVKRQNNKNQWDKFRFEAFDSTAKYINDYLHDGDAVSIIARPRQVSYQKKEGVKVEGYQFRVEQIGFICHRSKLLINQFGGINFPELPDIDYDL